MATMKMSVLNKSVLPARSTVARPLRLSQRSRVVVSAVDDTNVFINLLASTAAMSIPAAVTTATSEFREKEFERIQTLDGALPFIGAAGVDALFHSIPGLNLVFGLLAEPVGAAAGVAYMMSILLSSAAIDPKTLAPKGTVLNAEKSSNPVIAAVRVPFTNIIPTTLKVIDYSNDGYSGAAWKVVDGLPQLPLNSVAIILGVGCLILEAASHAPVLTYFMPRVLSAAGSLAAVGWAIDALAPKKTA